MDNLTLFWQPANEIISNAHTNLLLAKLTPRQKEVVEMLMADYTQEEIAGELSISQQAVAQLLGRARCNLTKFCEEKQCYIERGEKI